MGSRGASSTAYGGAIKVNQSKIKNLKAENEVLESKIGNSNYRYSFDTSKDRNVTISLLKKELSKNKRELTRLEKETERLKKANYKIDKNTPF